MLVNCVVYRSGRKVADIPREDISEYVAQPDCFVWVALKEPTAEELAVMQEEFGLHPLAVEDASKGHQRPKFEDYGDNLFVVLHTLDLVDGEVAHGEAIVQIEGSALRMPADTLRQRLDASEPLRRCFA